jgi:hypothetical protein
MTIKFYCPNCDAIIAFDSKHCGKRARCLTCGQLFIIPSKDDEVPQKVKQEIEKGEPEPGFYRAVFIESWKLFADRENITSLAFVTAVVCFKFFLAPAMCCMSHISFVFVWGWLFGFYLNIIYETAFGIDKLPEIYLGTSITFLWYVIKPFLVFLSTMAMVQLPFIVVLALLQNKELTYHNMWTLGLGLYMLPELLFILGLFLFPMAILTTALGQDFTLLRPDYLIAPVFRAPGPYIVVVVLLVATGVLESQMKQFSGLAAETFLSSAGKLMLNLAVQIIAIVAMRSIGLFYRHYSCYLKW